MSESPNSLAVTHIAGQTVTIDGRYLRQRCAWCGAIIEDVDLTTIAVAVVEGEEPPGYPTWPSGHMVLVDGGYTVDLGTSGETPPEACFNLDPAVTR